MNIFKSEQDMLEVLDAQDQLVLRCAAGRIRFWDFCDQNHDFYWYYALDGHESDESEKLLLLKHKRRIEPHRIIAEEILSTVCKDEDMKNPLYIQAGRFGSDVALEKLRQVAKEHLKWSGQQSDEQNGASPRRLS